MTRDRFGNSLGGESFEREVEKARRARDLSGAVSPKQASRGSGRSQNTFFNGNLNLNSPLVNLLTVGDESGEAQPWIVTLAPPETANIGNAAPADPQATGGPFMSNGQLFDSLAAGNLGADVLIANAIASLEWGAGSVVAKAECDFSNGLTLNLFAAYIRLNAFVESNVFNQGNNLMFRLGAFAVPGQGSRTRAQRTFQFSGGAVGAESAVKAVPKFAKSVSLTGSDRLAAAVTGIYTGVLRFWRSLGGQADTSNVIDYFFAGNSDQPLPVPNGAWYFSVVNQLNAPVQQVVFDLAI